MMVTGAGVSSIDSSMFEAVVYGVVDVAVVAVFSHQLPGVLLCLLRLEHRQIAERHQAECSLLVTAAHFRNLFLQSCQHLTEAAYLIVLVGLFEQ